MHLKKLISICMLSIFLSSCLLIEDFGEFWDKATIDHQLVGAWYRKNANKPVMISKNDDHLFYISSQTGKKRDKTKLKTIKISGHKFILMRNPESQALFKYEIIDTTLTLFGPDRQKRDEFQLSTIAIQDFVELSTEGIRIKTLNNDVMRHIIDSINNKLWQKVAILHKGAEENRPAKSIEEIIEDNKLEPKISEH